MNWILLLRLWVGMVIANSLMVWLIRKYEVFESFEYSGIATLSCELLLSFIWWQIFKGKRTIVQSYMTKDENGNLVKRESYTTFD